MCDRAELQTRATQLLTGFVRSDDPGFEELSLILYDELRSLAYQMMSSERANHTLQPTALVNEAFMRLINAEDLDINSKDHFYALASQTMRRVLIDSARASGRQKRGGDRKQVSLTIAEPQSKGVLEPDELIAIDESLERLRALDERKAKIIELRFFGGLDEETTARILGISRSTASNDWRVARAWLLKELSDHGSRGEDA
jgi:RNA polymerase sigma factor (TIGR02999 family)